MRKKAFKKGFVDGFGSPFSVFIHRPIKTDRYRVSVEAAVRDVSEVFKEVMTREGVILEQSRNKMRSHSGKAA